MMAVYWEAFLLEPGYSHGAAFRQFLHASSSCAVAHRMMYAVVAISDRL